MSDQVRVDLGEVFDISGACEFKEAFTRAFEHSSIQIDGARLERVDSAAIQLLFAFRKEAILMGKSVEWCRPSDRLVDSIRTLGLEVPMGLESICADRSQEQ